MAIKEATKVHWDWSEAGQDLPITNEHLYLKIKGRFTWVKGAQPEYAWYNGTGIRYLLGDEIDPDSVTKIAAPLGDRNDPKAKIYPFKIHRGRQVYDRLMAAVHIRFGLPAQVPVKIKKAIKKTYQTIYHSDLNISQALAVLEGNIYSEEEERITAFFLNSERGVTAHR